MTKVVLIILGGQGTMAAGPDVEVSEYRGLYTHEMTVTAEHEDREAKRATKEREKAAREKEEKERGPKST